MSIPPSRFEPPGARPAVAIAGASVTPLPSEPPLSIEIEPSAPANDAFHGVVQDEWTRLCAANPRLFDGPMLGVTGIDADRAVITCVRESFRRLAVQPAVATGVRLLGVSGIIIGRDRRGEEHVLLGRRGHQTRVYGGMWELAPGGGVDVPRDGVPRLSHADITQELRKETLEETGLEVDVSAARAIAVTHDHAGSSDIIAVRVELPGTINPRAGGAGLCRAASDWEYIDRSWLACSEAQAFEERFADAIIPPMRAMLRFMRWTPS